MERQKARAVLAVVSLGVATLSVDAGEPRRALPLKPGEISKALVGKRISYVPPGWTDAGLEEEFHPDGIWRGLLYDRVPIPFSGRWSIDDGKMCVTADRGNFAERWHTGRHCRLVWKNRTSGELLIDYLPDQRSSSRKIGLQTLSVRELATIK